MLDKDAFLYQLFYGALYRGLPRCWAHFHHIRFGELPELALCRLPHDFQRRAFPVHRFDPLGRHIGLLSVNVPDALVVNVRLGVHGLDVVHPEGQYILVVDGIHNSVSVELVAEGLGGGKELCSAGRPGIGRKDGGASKPKQMILLEILDDSRVHVAELAAVALVEDNDHPFSINRVSLLLLDGGGQLLDGSDDNVGVVVLQLLFQHGGRGVAVGRPLFKAVVLLHGLVVQILPVYHKQYLVDVGQLGGQAGRLEGSQRLAAAGGVPDVAAALDGAILLVVVSDLNAVQNPLGGGDLIGPHDHQHIFRGENAVPGQHIQNGVLGKEGAGEVDEVRDHPVVGVSPERGKLKAVAGLLLFRLAGGRLPDGVEAGGIEVVLGIGAVGDNEDLHILEEAATRPEGVPLVAVDLVEGLPNSHAPALDLNMYQGQTVDQHRHIVAVVVLGPLLLAHLILVDDLETVVVNVLLGDEGDVLGSAVIPPEHLHKVLLNLPGLLHDVLIGVGNCVG